MIKIWTGVYPVQTGNSGDGLILQNPNEYPDLRLKIREALKAGEQLSVMVTHRACDNWFWDLEGITQVQLIDGSPVQLLKDKLNIPSIPQELVNDPTQIIKLGLLDIELPPSVSEDVWSWILRTKLGNVWANGSVDEKHLSDLMNWYIANSVPSEYKDIVAARLKNWALHAPMGYLRRTYSELQTDTESKVWSLAVYNLLEMYGAERFDILKSFSWFTEALLNDSTNYRVQFNTYPQKIAAELSSKLNIHLRQRFSKRSPFIEFVNQVADTSRQPEILTTVEEILANLSGLLPGELDALIEVLRSVTEYLTPNELGLLLRLKFKSISYAEKRIDQFLSTLAPDFPSPPDSQWDVKEWINWSITQYMPYRQWTFLYNKNIPELDEYSLQFEQWLYQRYPTLIARADKSLVSYTEKQVSEELEKGRRVVWVFIDNLAYLWQSELESALHENNIDIESPEARISVLPTLTETSKRVVLLGGTPKQRFTIQKWELALSERWSKYNISIVDKISELDHAVVDAPNIVMVTTSMLDIKLHNQQDDIFERVTEIKNYLKSFFSKISDAMVKLSQFGDVALVISTDHGCTMINRQVDPVKMPAFIESDPEMDKHRRYIKFSSTRDIDPQKWWVLTPQSYELPTQYAVPKGRVSVDKYPLGFTHGGLTPEEVMVPSWVCVVADKEKASRKVELKLSHNSNPLRLIDRPQKIQIEVYNPSAAYIHQLNVRLPECRAIFDTVFTLPPNSTTVIESDIVIPVSSEVDDVFVTPLTYYGKLGNGQRLEVQVDFKIKISKIYKSQMDDLFEDLF